MSARRSLTRGIGELLRLLDPGLSDLVRTPHLADFVVSSITYPSNNIYLLEQQFSGRYPVRQDDRWLQNLDGRDGSAVIPIR